MKFIFCGNERLPKRDGVISFGLIFLLILCISLCVILGSQSSLVWAALGFVLVVLIATNFLILKIPFFPYDRVLSATSNEDQLIWHKEPGIRVNVGRNKQVYYPKVVTLDYGWRMYYRAGDNRAHIASAYSTDGMDWIEESGIRISSKDCDDDVVRIEGCDVVEYGETKKLMYFSATDGRFWRIYLSESDDGLNWSKGIRCIDVLEDDVNPNVKAPSVIKLRQGGWRMYFMKFSNSEKKIYTSFSHDGFVWSEPTICRGIGGSKFGVGNPLVIHGKTSLRMYFSQRSFKSDPRGAAIYSAISLDGIHWEREEGVRIGPGPAYDRHGIFNVDIVPIDSGYRMYYTGYWGRHWFEPLTMRYYSKVRERENKAC